MATQSPSGTDKPRLSRKQTIVWYAAAVFTLFGTFFALSTQVNVREPFIACVYIVGVIAMIYFERLWIRDNTDHEGKRLKK